MILDAVWRRSHINITNKSQYYSYDYHGKCLYGQKCISVSITQMFVIINSSIITSTKTAAQKHNSYRKQLKSFNTQNICLSNEWIMNLLKISSQTIKSAKKKRADWSSQRNGCDNASLIAILHRHCSWNIECNINRHTENWNMSINVIHTQVKHIKRSVKHHVISISLPELSRFMTSINNQTNGDLP